MKTLVLFDIDGTLIARTKTRDRWTEVFPSVYGVQVTQDDFGDYYGKPFQEFLYGILEGKGVQRDEAISGFDRFQEESARIMVEDIREGTVVLCEGVPFLLEELVRKNFCLGLATGNTRDIAYAKLVKTKLDRYFPVGGFGDDAVKREEIVRIAINRAEEEYGVFDPQNIYVVGDTEKDIDSAHCVGVRSIAVATGPRTLDYLREHNPTHAFLDLCDTSGFIEVLGIR